MILEYLVSVRSRKIEATQVHVMHVRYVMRTEYVRWSQRHVPMPAYFATGKFAMVFTIGKES